MEDASQYDNALISIEMPYAMAVTIMKSCLAGKPLGAWEREQIIRDFGEAIHDLEREHNID